MVENLNLEVIKGKSITHLRKQIFKHEDPIYIKFDGDVYVILRKSRMLAPTYPD